MLQGWFYMPALTAAYFHGQMAAWHSQVNLVPVAGFIVLQWVTESIIVPCKPALPSCYFLTSNTQRQTYIGADTLLSSGVKRLYDLVKIRDKALRCAFFYALGNTLVANDLEQASRIAYGNNKRWSRVVTLQVQIQL